MYTRLTCSVAVWFYARINSYYTNRERHGVTADEYIRESRKLVRSRTNFSTTKDLVSSRGQGVSWGEAEDQLEAVFYSSWKSRERTVTNNTS